MESLVWGAHVILAVVLIVLILLQHGKGADMGAAFGSGSAGSLFGPSGSATFLSRATSFTAAMFFVTSMSLTYFSTNQNESTSIMNFADGIEQPQGSIAEGNVSVEQSEASSEADSGSKVNQIPE